MWSCTDCLKGKWSDSYTCNIFLIIRALWEVTVAILTSKWNWINFKNKIVVKEIHILLLDSGMGNTDNPECMLIKKRTILSIKMFVWLFLIWFSGRIRRKDEKDQYVCVCVPTNNTAALNIVLFRLSFLLLQIYQTRFWLPPGIPALLRTSTHIPTYTSHKI